MKSPFEKLLASMASAVAKRISFDPTKVVKNFKYTITKEIKEGNVSLTVGTGGKVFNGIILGNNSVTGEKVMILIREGNESPYTMMLTSSRDNNLDDYVNAANENVSTIHGEDFSHDFKNKSLKTSFLARKAVEVLSYVWYYNGLP